ncbi:immunoglobulin J chain [Pteropus medius]|uniref:immunoglobulin J chain n=1 Tax=Pteropus vampyrus TaxID=132908 RepID=UPI00196BB040|nr:immunoglobulin J chain [Pteropus giganteus]
MSYIWKLYYPAPVFKRSEVKMKNHLLFWGVLVIFIKAILVTAQDEDERTLLVDNKCKCARITSRIIPSPEDPSQDIVERNIRIKVPLNNRENISDPTSPRRTKFVYHLSDLCKNCDPAEVELDNQVVTVTQSNICDEDNETCYAYDRNKCYTNRVPLLYGGKTIMVETALTPDSCYPD